MTFAADFDSVVLSPNHGGPTGTIVALCFHDEEYPEIGTAAEDTAAFFSRTSSGASTTGAIDNNSKVGCVPYGVKAWHSGAGDPWNGAIEGYEHSGYAKQSRSEWIDVYGLQMLELSAAHFAKRCTELGIPIRYIGAAQLAAAVQARNPALGGICGHIEITRAAGVYGGHTDPGPNFPWDYYIGRVQHFAGGGDPDQQIVNTPAQPIKRSAPMAYAYKFDDKPAIWVTERRPTGPTLPGTSERAMQQWYVPVDGTDELTAMVRSGEIGGLRLLAVGPEKGGSGDYDAAFAQAQKHGRVVGA